MNVIQVGSLDDGVHAAEGQGNEGAGDAGAAVENGVGVGAGVAATCLVLDDELGLLSGGDEALDDKRVICAAMGNSRAAAEGDVAELGGIKAGSVRGVGDI